MKLKVGKKSGLKYFGYDDIQRWKPCYDPSKHIDKIWRGTAVDILSMERVPPVDRLWCALRTELVSGKVLRLFAVWSARQVQYLMKDARSIKALDVAERFANGQATKSELSDAYASASASTAAATVAAAYASTASASTAAAYASAYASASASTAASAAKKAQVEKLIEMIKSDALETRAAKKGLRK